LPIILIIVVILLLIIGYFVFLLLNPKSTVPPKPTPQKMIQVTVHYTRDSSPPLKIIKSEVIDSYPLLIREEDSSNYAVQAVDDNEKVIAVKKFNPPTQIHHDINPEKGVTGDPLSNVITTDFTLVFPYNSSIKYLEIIDPAHQQIDKKEFNSYSGMSHLQTLYSFVDDKMQSIISNSYAEDVNDGTLDILYLSSDFSNESSFKQTVNQFTGVLFNTEPYKSRKNQIQIHTAFTTDDLECDPTKGFACEPGPVEKAARNSKENFDIIMVIINDDTGYGGAGYLAEDYYLHSASVTTKAGPYAAMHEMGHMLGGLLDEYLANNFTPQKIAPKGVYKNCYNGTIPNTQVSDPFWGGVEPKEFAKGCNFVESNTRSSVESIMRYPDNNTPASRKYNTVSERIMNDGVTYYAGAPTAVTPPADPGSGTTGTTTPTPTAVPTPTSSTSTGIKSAIGDYSTLSETVCGQTGSSQYCSDAGRWVTELPKWESGKCVAKITDNRTCKIGDKYGNKEDYKGSPGEISSGVVGENKPIVDNRVSPELEKLAEQCGFKKEDASTLGIPFFKIAVGENLSVNSEQCKKLLADQINYFQQANIRALTKLKEAASAQGLEVTGTGQEGYTVKAAEGSTKTAEEIAAVQKEVDKVNTAQKTIDECQKKSVAEQAECAKKVQEDTQKSAETGNAAASGQSKIKMEQVLSGNLPEGKEEMCVKADMGVAPLMDAEGIKHKKAGEDYRLLVCRKKGEAKIKWRVLVGGLATGEERITKDPVTGVEKKEVGAEGDPTDSNNKTDACGNGKDCGNDAERLTKLHPTGSGDPVFVPPVVINTCVSLTSNEPEKVRAILAPYFAAAGTAGKAAGCERTPRKPDAPKPGAAGTGSGTGSGSSGSSGSTTKKECATKAGCKSKGDDWDCVSNSCVFAGTKCTKESCAARTDGKTKCHSSGQCQKP